MTLRHWLSPVLPLCGNLAVLATILDQWGWSGLSPAKCELFSLGFDQIDLILAYDKQPDYLRFRPIVLRPLLSQSLLLTAAWQSWCLRFR